MPMPEWGEKLEEEGKGLPEACQGGCERAGSHFPKVRLLDPLDRMRTGSVEAGQAWACFSQPCHLVCIALCQLDHQNHPLCQLDPRNHPPVVFSSCSAGWKFHLRGLTDSSASWVAEPERVTGCIEILLPDARKPSRGSRKPVLGRGASQPAWQLESVKSQLTSKVVGILTKRPKSVKTPGSTSPNSCLEWKLCNLERTTARVGGRVSARERNESRTWRSSSSSG